jgi:hypothetical protein
VSRSVRDLVLLALKTADEFPNRSELSNVAAGTTLPAPPSPPPLDGGPPAPVADLSASAPTDSSPRPLDRGQDDGNQARRNLRSALLPRADHGIQRTRCGGRGEPMRGAAAEPESLTVGGLEPGSVYYFALKVADEVPNWSALSNVASDTSLSVDPPAPPDTTAPAAVRDLAATARGESDVTLAWTAPGDDDTTGTAAEYDLRVSTQPITRPRPLPCRTLASVLGPGQPGRGAPVSAVRLRSCSRLPDRMSSPRPRCLEPGTYRYWIGAVSPAGHHGLAGSSSLS